LFYAENCDHMGYYAVSSGNSLRYHYLLLNNTEEHSSYVHRDGGLVSRMFYTASLHTDLESI